MVFFYKNDRIFHFYHKIKRKRMFKFNNEIDCDKKDDVTVNCKYLHVIDNDTEESEKEMKCSFHFKYSTDDSILGFMSSVMGSFSYLYPNQEYMNNANLSYELEPTAEKDLLSYNFIVYNWCENGYGTGYFINNVSEFAAGYRLGRECVLVKRKGNETRDIFMATRTLKDAPSLEHLYEDGLKFDETYMNNALKNSKLQVCAHFDQINLM